MNYTRIFALIALLGLASELPAASNGSANVSSVCATVEFMGKMISLNILLPADYDDINELYDMQDSLAELNLLVCQPVILTGYSRGNSRYSNGSLATNYFWAFDVTWYYPDAQIITYESGYSGGRWFYPFPRLDGGIGQEVISSEWGIEDESFSYLNFTATGSLFTSRERIRTKLIFDDFELLDVPGVLLLITRLYQYGDIAKDYAPADINITGVPF